MVSQEISIGNLKKERKKEKWWIINNHQLKISSISIMINLNIYIYTLGNKILK